MIRLLYVLNRIASFTAISLLFIFMYNYTIWNISKSAVIVFLIIGLLIVINKTTNILFSIKCNNKS